MNYQAVIFDFDYTLADSSRGVIECINFALGKLQMPIADEDTIRATIGHSLRDTLRILTKSESGCDATEFARLFASMADEVMLDNTFLLNDARDSVAELRDRGIRLAIVTSKFRYRIDAFLKREGLSHCFDTVVGAEDVSYLKPDPDGLNTALGRLCLGQDDVIYIGDSVVDAEAAERAQVKFIAVLSGVTPGEDFRPFHPLAVIKDLSKLCPMLFGDR